MEKQTKKISILTITLVASLGGFLFGFDMAVVSGVLPLLQKQFSLSAFQEGWFVSSALVGCIVGVAFSGELTDRIGRKKPMLISAVLFFLSALGCATMPSLFLITASRFIGGVGIGLASNLVPLYISEIAPARSRGRLITYYQFALTLGILIAYLTNAGLLNYSLHHTILDGDFLVTATTTEVWRSMLGLGALPAILFLLGLTLVPESPRWLFQQGRISEGKNIMTAIGMGAESEKEVSAIIKNDDDKVSYKELFSPRWRKALLIGLLLPLFSQFSGINAIIYYGPGIFEKAGINSSNALLFQVIIGAVNLLFTIVAIKWADKYGRKLLLTTGLTGIVLSLVFCGVLFYTGNTQGPLLLILMLLYIACFAFSLGPVTWIIINEIFPTDIRVKAVSVCTLALWIAVWMVGQFFPWLLEKTGPAVTFWIFALCSLINFFFSWKVVKETKGKTLEEMENVFIAPH